MDKPILIGLHAVKRAGKDTTARFITEWGARSDPALSARKRGFADKAKWSWARQFMPNCTMEEAISFVDYYKESDARVVIEFPSSPSQHVIDIGFRQCMAQAATEGARDIYGDDHWVDHLLPLSRTFDAHDLPIWMRWHDEFDLPGLRRKSGSGWEILLADLCLIIDVRFENEVERIKKLDGYVIKVRRKDAEDAVIEEARRQGREVHRSELGLPDELFDFVINNDDNDMDRARQRTNCVMDRIAGVAA